ncbi:MAG: hypothetical protein HKP41_03115 [Desulfobacterales bacterium]|nr:hypothetical protein [Deltaproteobacteria bacterium]NNK93320.1 hypothetical protein [Desulfobacterales bacterium]
MIQDKHLLIVAGTGRNVGKTEFACRLIGKLSSMHEIYSLKVSAVYPDEGNYHGNHSEDFSKDYLFEEHRKDTEKDTSRMLRAGARKAFYLSSDSAGIARGFNDFRKLIPDETAIVCESNSLWQYVKPGLLILISSADEVIKPRARLLLNHADMMVVSDLISGFPEVNRIELLNNNTWLLSHPLKG